MAEIIRKFVASTVVDSKKDRGRTSTFEIRIIGTLIFLYHLAGRLPYEMEVEEAVRRMILEEYPAEFVLPFLATPRCGAYRFVVERTDDTDFEAVSIEEAFSKSDPYPTKRELYRRTAKRKIERMCVDACDFLDIMVTKGWLGVHFDRELNRFVFRGAFNSRVPLDVEMLRPRRITEEPGWIIDDWGVCIAPPNPAIVNLDNAEADECDVDIPEFILIEPGSVATAKAPSCREVYETAKDIYLDLDVDLDVDLDLDSAGIDHASSNHEDWKAREGGISLPSAY